MKAAKPKKRPTPELAKAHGKRIAKRDDTKRGAEIQPTLLKTDARMENLPLANMVPFGDKDIKVKKCHYASENHEIPFLRIHVKQDITIDLYGSHFESPEDDNLTYLIHNLGRLNPVSIGHFENPVPTYVQMISNTSSGWKIESLVNRELAGDSFKTVFQGFKGDNQVLDVLLAVRKIKSNSEPYITKLIRNAAGKLELIKADGGCLMDFLRPVIKTANYKKLKLIEKCIKYLESPTQTKMERTFKAIKHLCEKLNRPPTPKEIFDHIHPDILNRGGQYRDIYRDLRDLGLGWLIKKY
jgi:hypothetical protein